MKNTEKQLRTSLVEQIITSEVEHHRSGRSGRSGINLALFLVKKEEIARAVEAGLNSKIIWETLQDNKEYLGGYESFRRYVKLYIKTG